MRSDQSLPLVRRLDESALLDSQAISKGAFLVDVGLPQLAEVVSRAYMAADSFFSLEDSEKQAFDARPNGTIRGWTKTNSTAADLESGHHRDYEAFDVAVPRAKDPSNAIAGKLFDQANVWPSEEFRVASEALMRDVCAPLERYIWSLLERSAGLAVDYYSESYAGSGVRYLRYLTYPLAGAAHASPGFYQHKDFEAFTIHLEDTPGIEIQDPGAGNWILAGHDERHCLVLIGQLGELLTSGKLRAALHRVRIQPSRHRRHSIAYFVAPSFDTPLPAGDVGDGDAVDTAGSYLTRRFMKSFGIAR